MRYMLDTDPLVCVFNARPHHQAVLERFDREDPRKLCVSAITLAELRFGAEKSRKAKATQDKHMRAIDTLHVAPFEAGAAAQYGVVRAALEQAGTPIGPVDTLIAGHALSLHLTLVTGNVRGFSRVDGLRVENWVPQ